MQWYNSIQMHSKSIVSGIDMSVDTMSFCTATSTPPPLSNLDPVTHLSFLYVTKDLSKYSAD